MNSGALFGLSVLMSFVAFGLVTKIYLVPTFQVMRREVALTAPVIPHTFRFLGLSFLIPGVVAASLSPAFAAVPAFAGSLIVSFQEIICQAEQHFSPFAEGT